MGVFGNKSPLCEEIIFNKWRDNVFGRGGGGGEKMTILENGRI